jgi:hypothetical protein
LALAGQPPRAAVHREVVVPRPLQMKRPGWFVAIFDAIVANETIAETAIRDLSDYADRL